MAETTKMGGSLQPRQVNRTVLARQHLLRRSRAGIRRVLEDMGGLQAQYAPSMYIGLWSRVEKMRRDELTAALERRQVVQGTLMRSTIHLVSAADYPWLASALRSPRREWWLGVTRKTGPTEEECRHAAEVVGHRLEEGPASAAELVTLVEGAGLPKRAWDGVGLWLDMVRVPPSGTWEHRRADRYAAAHLWLGVSPAGEEEGRRLLVRRYLSGFGPAPAPAVASWAGVPVGLIRRAMASMRLNRHLTADGVELFDLPRATLPPGDVTAPPRFLPTWDATLLAHARHTGILPEEYRPLVFDTKNPASVPVFLVDGHVAGAWRAKGGEVTMEPFGPIPRRFRKDLDEEKSGLEVFLSDQERPAL